MLCYKFCFTLLRKNCFRNQVWVLHLSYHVAKCLIWLSFDIVISLHVSFGRTVITCQRANLFSGIFISWRDISDLFLQRRLKRSYQAIINSKDGPPLRMQVFHTQPYSFFFLVIGLTRIRSQPEQLSGCWKVWFALHKVSIRCTFSILYLSSIRTQSYQCL